MKNLRFFDFDLRVGIEGLLRFSLKLTNKVRVNYFKCLLDSPYIMLECYIVFYLLSVTTYNCVRCYCYLLLSLTFFVFSEEINFTIEKFVTTCLPVYLSKVFTALEPMISLLPAAVHNALPAITTAVLTSEKKRGVGADHHLRHV